MRLIYDTLHCASESLANDPAQKVLKQAKIISVLEGKKLLFVWSETTENFTTVRKFSGKELVYIYKQYTNIGTEVTARRFCTAQW